MPSPNPTTRREYKGAAVATTLNGAIVSGATSFVIVSSASWPTGAVGNFIVTIDRGLATEERIKCSAQSAGTVTVAASGRGFDSTTAQAHANGATVECTLSAFDADEWNQHTNATSGVHGYAGAGVGTTDAQALTNKTLASPAFTGTATGLSAASAVLDAASTVGGVSGTSLAADRTAYTAYTPTVSNITVGNGSLDGFYKQIGKTVDFTARLVLGSTTVISAHPGLGLPATTAAREYNFAGIAYDSSADTTYTTGGHATGSSSNALLTTSSGNLSSTVPFTFATGDVVEISGTFEAV